MIADFLMSPPTPLWEVMMSNKNNIINFSKPGGANSQKVKLDFCLRKSSFRWFAVLCGEV